MGPRGAVARSVLPYRFYKAADAGTRFAPLFSAMKKRKKSGKRSVPDDPQALAERARAEGGPEEDLLGPPARETIMLRDDRERELEEELALHTESSPKLTAGDLDADWQRAATVGEEAPGGTVATPDQPNPSPPTPTP